MAQTTWKPGDTPRPVKHDSRNCFGVNYYASAAEADEAVQRARGVRAANGGWYHGTSVCRMTMGPDANGLFPVMVP